MSALPFISDDQFDKAVERLIARIQEADAQSSARLEKNVRDPFALVSQACLFEIDRQTLDRLDGQRTVAQAISAAVGDFHQHVLGAMPGWKEHDALVDLVHEEKRIAAEVKNKHNTLNADNKRQVLNNIESFLRAMRTGEAWSGYFVAITPKSPGQPPKEVRPNVQEIDGRSFYALASGYDDALAQVFAHLPGRIHALRPGSSRPEPDPEVLAHCETLFRHAHIPSGGRRNVQRSHRRFHRRLR